MREKKIENSKERDIDKKNTHEKKLKDQQKKGKTNEQKKSIIPSQFSFCQ